MGADGVVNGSAKLPITQTLLVKECVLLLRPNVPVKYANFSREERRPLGPIALTRYTRPRWCRAGCVDNDWLLCRSHKSSKLRPLSLLRNGRVGCKGETCGD